MNCDSIQVVRNIDASGGWKKRKEVILPLAVNSMCQIERLCKSQNVSLGLFRPNRNIEFSWEPVSTELKPGAENRYAQLELFSPQKDVLEKIPYIFRYHYFCEDEPECNGHNQAIIDWEIGEAYRRWRRNYSDEDTLLEKIRERWLDLICSEKNDVYFYVGNMQRFRKNFMVLGVFYPPRLR